MRIKGRLKDIILILLILFTLFLVTQIWFSSSVIPYGGQSIGAQMHERMIEPVLRWFGKGKNGTFSQNVKSLMLPKKIILNQTNKRAVLRSDNEDYYRVLQIADGLMQNLMSGKAQIKSKEMLGLDEYCAVLKGNSVYLDYDAAVDFRLFSVNICGSEKNVLSGDFTAIREYMISLEDNVLNNVTIYVRDDKSGNVMRYVIAENKRDLENMMTGYFKSNEPETTLNYSFELNFHKQESGDGALSKLVFRPLILFNLVAAQEDVLEVENKAYHVLDGADSAHISGILRAFQINPMTTNKYTDLTNANIFVENDATLVISPDGYLTYQAVDGGRGLPLVEAKDKGNADIYTAVSSAVEWFYTLNEEIPDAKISDLRFCSDLTEGGTPGSYTIEFDLYVGGLPVLQSNEEGGKPCHAVTMVIENGCLKQYRQFIRDYRVIPEKKIITPVINAVDGLIDTLNSPEEYMTITNAGKCYWDSRQQELLAPRWKIDVDGVDAILTVE